MTAVWALRTQTLGATLDYDKPSGVRLEWRVDFGEWRIFSLSGGKTPDTITE